MDSRAYKLGPIGNLNQVIRALSKTIRAMADGSLDDERGARICNGLGIMRACLETATLQTIEQKLEQAARRAIVSAGSSSSASAHVPIEDGEEVRRLQ
jgi:hypothetical protein